MDVQNSRIGKRLLATGMLESGISQKQIAQTLGVTDKTIWNWKTRSLSGKSMADKPRSGLPKRISRVPNIIITKSLGKRWQSTRKLARIVERVNEDTLHRYLRNTFGAKPHTRPSHPKLSEKQKEQRLQFCLSHKFCDEQNWKRVLFSDEGSFELFHPTNRQNDRVWIQNPRNIVPAQTVKFPLKIMVWGMISGSGL